MLYVVCNKTLVLPKAEYLQIEVDCISETYESLVKLLCLTREQINYTDISFSFPLSIPAICHAPA